MAKEKDYIEYIQLKAARKASHSATIAYRIDVYLAHVFVLDHQIIHAKKFKTSEYFSHKLVVYRGTLHLFNNMH